MKFKAILFDINGTLVDILTDEGLSEIYRSLSNYLGYHGIDIAPDKLRKEYFARMQRQKKESAEEFPEFDTVQLWQELILEYLSEVEPDEAATMALQLAKMYRAISMFTLKPYPGVIETLALLAERYRLGVLSDAQSAWAVPELKWAGLATFFETVVVSGDLGYRKPDPRIFSLALEQMELSPEEVLFVGNDMYRDIYGAQMAKMKAVYFATNQGRSKHKGVEPDYIIYNFDELLTAVAFLEE